MTTITEDYVSFETAKLLKEKGFNVSCMGRYSVRSKEFHLDCTRWCNNGGLFECAAPTPQMVMKWLREVHNIVINIGWGEVFENKFQWWCIILNHKDGSIFRESEYYATYEESCETGIKYCLQNLI